MDASRFDALVRSLHAASSRRGALAGLAAAVVASGAASAKKKKKPDFNAFGCVDVGGFCFGKDALCCSGRCEGKKPKKGKRDKRRCAAHDASTCVAGENSCDDLFVPCVTTKGSELGGCLTTTGNAPYCTREGVSCRRCTKDADCVANCGAGAACVQCDGSGIGCLGGGDAFCVGLDVECT